MTKQEEKVLISFSWTIQKLGGLNWLEEKHKINISLPWRFLGSGPETDCIKPHPGQSSVLNNGLKNTIIT